MIRYLLLPVPIVAIVMLLYSCSPSESPSTKNATVDLSPLISRAQTELASGRYLQAISTCQQGLNADSTSVDLLNIMATAYASEGRYALAINALERIVGLQPESALPYLNLGGIYTKLGQYDQAEVFLHRALKRAPNQPEIHRRLGEVYLGTERFTQAVDHFSTALQLFPNSATLHYYLGRAYEGAGQDQNALVAFTQSTAIDSGFSECFYRIAQLARRVQQQDLARRSLLKFQTLQRIGDGDPDVPKQMKKLRASVLNAPESPMHHERLGSFFAQHNFFAEAANLFEIAASLPGVELAQLSRMGKLMLRVQQPAVALNLFKRSIQLQSDHIPSLLNIGVALELLRRNEEAQAYYRRVQQLAPEDPRGWYAYGLGEFNAGRLSSARQAWETCLRLTAPNTPLRQQVEQRLAETTGT
jgi:tetratricopeptide (TPR) repeat protein